MNNVVLMGRMVRDCEIRRNGDTGVYSFTVAVNKKDGCNFINCKAFGKTGENIDNFFKKGSMICIQGHLDVSSYQNKEGKNISRTDVVVNQFSFCGGKSSETSGDFYSNTNNNKSDDLPF